MSKTKNKKGQSHVEQCCLSKIINKGEVVVDSGQA